MLMYICIYMYIITSAFTCMGACMNQRGRKHTQKKLKWTWRPRA